MGAVLCLEKGPPPFSKVWGTEVLGLGTCELMGGVGESALVRGVSVWLRFLEAARPFCCAEELKTEDAVLAWELAEPTVFSVSPNRDSVSSGGKGGASAGCSSRRPWDWPDSSVLDDGVWLPLRSPRLDEGESADLNLAFSRWMARSLAALGAAGKYWAKLAPAGGGIATRRCCSPLPPSSARHVSRLWLPGSPCICACWGGRRSGCKIPRADPRPTRHGRRRGEAPGKWTAAATCPRPEKVGQSRC